MVLQVMSHRIFSTEKFSFTFEHFERLSCKYRFSQLQNEMKINWKTFAHNRISSSIGSNRTKWMKLNLMNPTIPFFHSFQIENWLTQFSVHEVLIASNEWNYAPFKLNEVKKVVKMSNLCYSLLFPLTARLMISFFSSFFSPSSSSFTAQVLDSS